MVAAPVIRKSINTNGFTQARSLAKNIDLPEIFVKAGPHLTDPSDLHSMIQFPDGTKSLLSKYLTKDIFLLYQNESDSAGVSFK